MRSTTVTEAFAGTLLAVGPERNLVVAPTWLYECTANKISFRESIPPFTGELPA
jgi:hypothetical protein